MSLGFFGKPSLFSYTHGAKLQDSGVTITSLTESQEHPGECQVTQESDSSEPKVSSLATHSPPINHGTGPKEGAFQKAGEGRIWIIFITRGQHISSN